MNKHIVNSLTEYNFTYDKNYGYGFINGYEVNVFNNVMAAGPLFLFSTFLSQSKKNDFLLKMNSFKIPLVQVGAFDFGVTILIGSMTGRSFEKKFTTVLSKILETLESLDAPKKDVCPQSGNVFDENADEFIFLPNTKIKIRVSNEGFTAINSTIEKINEDYRNAPNNYLRGFFGILIGALSGSVVAFVLGYFLNYITSLAPIISIIFGLFLCKQFGGKQNIVMIIISFVTTVIFILGALLFTYIFVANDLVAEAGYAYKGFNAFYYCLENSPEFKKAFVSDLMMSGLFTLLIEVLCIFMFKAIKIPKNLKK